MSIRGFAVRAGCVAAVLTVSASLLGCQSIREATGVAKLAPDEFTVLTKAPLILPPDYNLRPPQPGAAARNQPDPDDQARAALFEDPAMLSAQLGTNYSDGEKLLLTKANALTVDPMIRQEVNADSGQDDQGPAFTQKVLFGTPAAAATPAAPASPAASQAPGQAAH
jgi:Protein of unknown function (DUF3035)